jgi:cytochrome c553
MAKQLDGELHTGSGKSDARTQHGGTSAATQCSRAHGRDGEAERERPSHH